MSSIFESWAYFRTGLWRPETPIFHHTRGWDGRDEDGSVLTIRAVCGIPLDQWDRETGRRYVDSTVVHRNHAEKFARPCQRGCWK